MIGSFKDDGFEFGVADVAVHRVADAEQLVRVQDDELGVGDEDFGRLVVLDRLDESVDGVRQIDHVRLGLAAVELDHVAIAVAHLQTYRQNNVEMSFDGYTRRTKRKKRISFRSLENTRQPIISRGVRN